MLRHKVDSAYIIYNTEIKNKLSFGGKKAAEQNYTGACVKFLLRQ